MRRYAGPAAVALLATACSVGGGVPATTAGVTTTGAITTTTTTEPLPALCPATTLLPSPGGDDEVLRVAGADPVAAAVGFSAAVLACARDVVVVSTAELDRVALAARLAAAVGGPLLLAGATPHPALEAELGRLLPARVWLVGGDVEPGDLPAGTEVEAVGDDLARVAAVVNREAGAGETRTLPAVSGPATVAVTVQAVAAGEGLAAAPPPPATTTTEATVGSVASTSSTSATPSPGEEPIPIPEPLPVVLAGAAESGMAWLVEAGEPELALAAAAAAWSSGGLMALVDGADLRRIPEVGKAMRSAPVAARWVHLVGDITDDASWQLPLLREGEELPGGGYLLFPGRRLVALYGHAWAPELGVLGEQTPTEAVELIRTLAAEYAEEGLVVVPAFELIATVADSRAGDDGNYSNETALEDLRPWIRAAAEAGLYVLLDLQPGRTDFTTQARLYEEFLRLPYVGLALDPEWRLGPDQFHLQQYGSVPAAEINEVSAWLAGLVREENLPQKMLLLHQFRLSMLPDREAVVVPPELAVVIQMDGQGTLEAKYETWAAVTAGTEDAGWFWGWKNFYDEDAPMATPAQVLELRPSVVYVSYQ